MTTKKALFNGKSEILANFFAQQMPTRYRRVLSVLVNLKYPIHDKQSLCAQLEKVKEDDIIKQTITECFQPCDYGIDSVYSALEKFTANTTVNSTPTPSWVWNQNTMPTNQWVGHTTPGTTYPGWTNSTPPTNTYYRPSINQWNPPSMTSPTSSGQWQFGSDICGEAACTLFCDMVSRGIAPVNAYEYCCHRETLCRSVLPNYGTSIDAVRAQCIFVNNFVIQGREIPVCDWCAQFYLNNCTTTVNPNVNTVNNVQTRTAPTRTTNTVVAEFAN